MYHKLVNITENINAYSKVGIPTKLPNIPLPLFNGKMEEFSLFKH